MTASRAVQRWAVAAAAVAVLAVLAMLLPGAPPVIVAVLVPAALLCAPGSAVVLTLPLPTVARLGLLIPVSIALIVLSAWVSVLTRTNGTVIVPQILLAVSALVLATATVARGRQWRRP